MLSVAASFLLAAGAFAQDSNYVIADFGGQDAGFAIDVCTTIVTTSTIFNADDQYSVRYTCNEDNGQFSVTEEKFTDTNCQTPDDPASTSFTGDFKCDGQNNYGTVGVATPDCPSDDEVTPLASLTAATGVCLKIPVINEYGQVTCDAATGTLFLYGKTDTTCSGSASSNYSFAAGVCEVIPVPTGLGDFVLDLQAAMLECVLDDVVQTSEPTPSPTNVPTENFPTASPTYADPTGNADTTGNTAVSADTEPANTDFTLFCTVNIDLNLVQPAGSLPLQYPPVIAGIFCNFLDCVLSFANLTANGLLDLVSDQLYVSLSKGNCGSTNGVLSFDIEAKASVEILTPEVINYFLDTDDLEEKFTEFWVPFLLDRVDEYYPGISIDLTSLADAVSIEDPECSGIPQCDSGASTYAMAVAAMAGILVLARM